MRRAVRQELRRPRDGRSRRRIPPDGALARSGAARAQAAERFHGAAHFRRTPRRAAYPRAKRPENGVEIHTAPHNADLGRVGPHATVRASGDANRNGVSGESRVRHGGVYLGGHFRQRAFGFGKREPAGGQRHTGQRLTHHRRQFLRQTDAVRGGDVAGFLAVRGGDPAEQQVLLRREAHVRMEALNQCAKAVSQRAFNAAAGNRQAQHEGSIGAWNPTQMIRGVGPGERLDGSERGAQARLEFGAKTLDPPFLDHVLQTGELAIGAVAVVAVNRNDRAHHGGQTLRLHRA